MSHPDAPGHRLRRGFATRMLTAQAMVLGAGGVTTWLVASLLGPEIFRDHLDAANDRRTAAETRHIEEAFTSALLLSTGLALLAAAVAAFAVTWYLSHRVHGSITSVTEAASHIAAGTYGSRVRDPQLGEEFTTLVTTYNTLAERLEATETTRRRMLGDLAHELRTPLATIDAHLEAVEDGVRELDATTLTTLRSATRRLRRLAEDVSSVSRAEEHNLVVSPLVLPARTLLAYAAHAVEDRYAAAGVTLRADRVTDDRVMVDPDRMGQVLGNLLENALRHTSSGGTVTLGSRRYGKWVELVVSDSGEGIAPEHLPHVFDRFYRVDTARDRERGGAGIGLAIARAMTEAHGGSISVSSAGLGKGAAFTVRLPAVQP